MAPIVRLMQRFVIDYFNRHDLAVCREIMAEDYQSQVGDSVFIGREDNYVPAVARQFEQFPGLGMTVHGLLVGTDSIALHFSEHGASGGPGGRICCWVGIALFRSERDRFVACAAEEDYFARRRQLTNGVCDVIEPPAAAPWDMTPLPPNPQAEASVRAWLNASWPQAGVRCDDHSCESASLRFDVEHCEITQMFSADSGVAFHARQTGRYLGGLPGIVEPKSAVLFVAGIVEVVDGVVRSGRVIRDRAGLQRALKV
jgi:hypothetical protein